jgi:hypothetical protein
LGAGVTLWKSIVGTTLSAVTRRASQHFHPFPKAAILAVAAVLVKGNEDPTHLPLWSGFEPQEGLER